VEFRGDFQSPAPLGTTWEFVMDPERMARCGPGVREVEIIDDTHYRITARVGIGAIAANFRVDAEVTEVVEHERAGVRVTAHAPGTAVEGVASMVLADDGDGSRMDWRVEVTISGKLAAVGERLIRSTADRLINQTFECVRARLSDEAGTEPD
jgi:carbon monoxide dehydrogenase subunit G